MQTNTQLIFRSPILLGYLSGWYYCKIPMQILSIFDFLLAPIYFALIVFVGRRFRDRHYPPGHPWRAYFMPGLYFKLVGAMAVSFLYAFYYGGGDTSHYFLQAKIVNELFFIDPIRWANLVLQIPAAYDANYIEYTSRLMWYTAPNNFTVCSVAAPLSLISFNCYLPTSLLFSVISFSGCWALFRTFSRQYPHIIKYIGIATLYIPSMAVWGSGILKDTLCVAALGWITYTVFETLINRKLKLSNALIFLLAGYIIYIVKIYILIAFLPAIFFWILSSYASKIRIAFIKPLLVMVMLGVTILAFVAFADAYQKELGQYSLDNVGNQAEINRVYITETSTDISSTYDLGAIEPTIQGMLKKFPLAVNVTLFRPYLWESRKAIILVNSLETALYFFMFLKIIFTVGPLKMWRSIRQDPNLQFFLAFTLIFAFAVGISSANFGALSRYKIPCLPFFTMLLAIWYYEHKPEYKRLLWFVK